MVGRKLKDLLPEYTPGGERFGQDLDTAVNVGVGDPVAQTEQAMANIKQLLTEAGGRL